MAVTLSFRHDLSLHLRHYSPKAGLHACETAKVNLNVILVEDARILVVLVPAALLGVEDNDQGAGTGILPKETPAGGAVM